MRTSGLPYSSAETWQVWALRMVQMRMYDCSNSLEPHLVEFITVDPVDSAQRALGNTHNIPK